ncbi:MAG TPA: hypothetical protein VMB50_11140 [Myxococcales bacterium]|nr:hypothetical protein [Myxococcales bacterium]
MAETAVDLGTSGGKWMFKENGMVFGPVPARLLLDKLYKGEIGPDTEVAREEEENFRTLREVAFFTVHLAKAQAKLRVEQEESRIAAGERQGRHRRAATAVALVVAALALAGGGAYWAVVQRHRRLAQEVDEIPITPNPPELAAAERHGTRDVDFRLHGASAPAPAHRGNHRAPVPGTAPAEEEKTTAQYDKGSIVGSENRQKGSLIPCIREELHRSSDFRGDIRFSLAVGNDGHVAKLWMDDSRFKDGPLQACFWNAMSHWHFASYEGERATLSDSFHVGR